MSKAQRRTPAVADEIACAYTALDLLGHKPLSSTSRRGRDYACWLCSLTGVLEGGHRAGEIFEERCKS